MYKILFTVFILVMTNMSMAAEKEKNFLKVADPYIEMHTGPGRGYPIFYVVGRGEWIEVLYRQTNWFKVRTDDKKEGWVSVTEMAMTLNPSGERVAIVDPGEEDFRVRNWEYGALVGDFEGAAIISFYAGYHFTENISTEISLSQAVGSASSNILLGFHLVHQPFPEWPVSPYFTLGTGTIKTTPKSTIALSQDRTDQYANYGIGVRMHLTKRFLLRLDYRNYVIFTSRNDNEEIREWKAGFGFFF